MASIAKEFNQHIPLSGMAHNFVYNRNRSVIGGGIVYYEHRFAEYFLFYAQAMGSSVRLSLICHQVAIEISQRVCNERIERGRDFGNNIVGSFGQGV